MIKIFCALWNWKKRKQLSDIGKVKVTENGGFYMKSEDLFKDKKASISLLDKLDSVIKIKGK